MPRYNSSTHIGANFPMPRALHKLLIAYSSMQKTKSRKGIATAVYVQAIREFVESHKTEVDAAIKMQQDEAQQRLLAKHDKQPRTMHKSSNTSPNVIEIGSQRLYAADDIARFLSFKSLGGMSRTTGLKLMKIGKRYVIAVDEFSAYLQRSLAKGGVETPLTN